MFDGLGIALRTVCLSVTHFNFVRNLQISTEEITFLTEGEDPTDDNVVREKLFHPNLKLLLVSEGVKGCRYFTKVGILISCVQICLYK